MSDLQLFGGHSLRKKSWLRAECAGALRRRSSRISRPGTYTGGGFVPDEWDRRLRTRFHRTNCRQNLQTRCLRHRHLLRSCLLRMSCCKGSSLHSRLFWSAEYIFSPNDMVSIHALPSQPSQINLPVFPKSERTCPVFFLRR